MTTLFTLTNVLTSRNPILTDALRALLSTGCMWEMAAGLGRLSFNQSYHDVGSLSFWIVAFGLVSNIISNVAFPRYKIIEGKIPF